MLNMGFEKQWSISVREEWNFFKGVLINKIFWNSYKVVFLASNIANSIPHNEIFKNQDVCQRD